MRIQVISIMIVLSFVGLLQTIPLSNAETIDGNINNGTTYDFLRWQLNYGRGTIGAFVKDVKYKYPGSNEYWWVVKVNNVAFVEIGGYSCGLYDVFNAPSVSYSSVQGYVELTYSATNPCTYADSVTIKFKFQNDLYQVFVSVDPSSSYNSGPILNYVYWDAVPSQSSSTQDTTSYAFYSRGISGTPSAYDWTLFKWENGVSLENSGDYNNRRDIEIRGGYDYNNAWTKFYPDSDGTTDDDVYWLSFVNECTDCNIASNSQYTNGPGSYENNADILGDHLHVMTISKDNDGNVHESTHRMDWGGGVS